jgi:protein-tyrosine phosphatase
MAEAFQIASVTLGSGGSLGLCRLPGRYGELQKDVAFIQAWKPALVLSMTEKTEMEALGAAELPRVLFENNIGWRHFPIPDFGVPEPMIEANWPKISKEIHDHILAKNNVLLHCRGGIGRSGMVALRLMIEFGEQPDEALQRLRLVRAGAVETDAQLAWAKARL